MMQALVFSALVALATAGMQALPANLVRNGGFDEVENGAPAGWEAAGDPRTVSQTLDVVRDSGNPVARLRCTAIKGSGGATHAMLAQVGVRLERGRTYVFSCRARGEGIAGRGFGVAIQDTQRWEPCGLYQQVSLTRSWRPVRFLFRATRSVSADSRLQFWFVETGTLYIDDVRIEEIAPSAVRFLRVAPSSSTRNLVPNGSFEVGLDGWVSLGAPAGWGNLAHLHGRRMAEPGRGWFLRMPMGEGVAPMLAFDYLRPTARLQTRLFAASDRWIRIEPGANYTISADMRASEEGVPAAVGVVCADASAREQRRIVRQPVTLSREWRRFSLTFRAEQPYAYVTVGPALDDTRRVEVDVDRVQLERGDRPTPFAPARSVEVGVEPNAPGGIFIAGQGPAVTVRLHNHGAAPAGVRFAFRATDGFDRPAPAPPSWSVELPPGRGLSRRVALPPTWRGFYRLEVRWRAPDDAGASHLRLAIVPARTSSDSVLGLNHAFPDAALIRRALLGGVTWYRDWSLKWQDMEPEPGRWAWELGDVQIDRVRREGARLMALLPPFPSASWASEAPEGLPVTGYPGERLREAWAPRDPQLLFRFVEEAARRYRGRVGVYEFLNEPLYTSYALPGANVRDYPGKRYTVADYLRLLRGAAAAMRRADPTCRVIGGLGGGPNDLTREMMDAGLLDLIDILVLHIYPGARAPEGYAREMAELRSEMARRGKQKPVWVTEFSYYAADDMESDPFLPGEWNWAEERLLASELECAAYTVRFIAVMLARGAEKVFLHSGSSGEVNRPNLECCLFAENGTPRRALPALAVLAHWLGPRPRLAAERRVGTEGWLLAFETGSRSVAVAWNPGEEALALPRPLAPLRSSDMMGAPLPSAPIRLSGAPVYIVGPPGAATRWARQIGRAAP